MSEISIDRFIYRYIAMLSYYLNMYYCRDSLDMTLFSVIPIDRVLTTEAAVAAVAAVVTVIVIMTAPVFAVGRFIPPEKPLCVYEYL